MLPKGVVVAGMTYSRAAGEWVGGAKEDWVAQRRKGAKRVVHAEVLRAEEKKGFSRTGSESAEVLARAVARLRCIIKIVTPAEVPGSTVRQNKSPEAPVAKAAWWTPALRPG
jgi:hypothetical protein